MSLPCSGLLPREYLALPAELFSCELQAHNRKCSLSPKRIPQPTESMPRRMRGVGKDAVGVMLGGAL